MEPLVRRSYLPRALGGLWLELNIADYSDQMRRMAVELKRRDPCALDTEGFARQVEAEIPRWNILSKIAMPSLARSWSSVGRALLDDELTGLVVRAKAQLRSATSAAPQPATILPRSAQA